MTQIRRLAWITNLPAPYRFPIWDRLQEAFDLSILCMASNGSGRRWNVPDARYDIETLTSLRFEVPRSDITLYWPRIRRSLRVRRPDAIIVNGWDSPGYWSAAKYAKRTNIPLTILYESTQLSHRIRRGPLNNFRSRFFRAADSVLAVGEACREAVLAMRVELARCVMTFNYSPIQVTVPPVIGVRAHGHRFISVGRLVPGKRVDNVIRAFSAARIDDDELLIVGEGPDETRLRRLALQLGLEGFVTFEGYRGGLELAETYAAAQTLVLASDREVWGLVVNEALTCGLHAVVSSVAGVTASIRHMRGVYVAEPTVPSLTQAMRRSREEWRGSIANPEISRFGAAEFANNVIEAIYVASSVRRARHGERK
jgi:glycosyltransferase involved in cell wall biosynthesis